MRGEHVKRKVLALLSATAVVAALVSVAAPAGAAKPASGEPLQFGYVDSLTGASAVPSQRQAIEAYVNDWNERGGLDGQPIEVVFEEAGIIDTAKQLAAARTFGSNPKILAVLQPGICQVTAPLFATFQMPILVQPVNTTTCVQDPSFMFTQSPQANTLIALKWAIDEGVKSYGVIYPGLPQLRDGFVTPLEDYLALHPKLGVTLTVAEVPLVPTGADYDGAIAKLKAAGVTATFMAGTPTTTPLALQSGIRNGFGPADGVKWVLGSNLYDPKILPALPELEGTYILSSLYPWEDTSNKAVKKMNKAIGNEIENKDGFAQQGYQIGHLLEQSLNEIKGEVTREALLELWASKPFQKFQNALVPYTVDFTDGLSNPAGGMILAVKNGKFVTESDFVVIPAKQFVPKQ
jgi:branched-chain amino acid transport system substrate-binding protein